MTDNELKRFEDKVHLALNNLSADEAYVTYYKKEFLEFMQATLNKTGE